MFVSNAFILQLEMIPQLVAGVWGEDGNVQLEATSYFRKMLSIGNHCYVDTNIPVFIAEFSGGFLPSRHIF